MTNLNWLESRIVGLLIADLGDAGWRLDAYYDDADDTLAFVPVKSVTALCERIYDVGTVTASFTNADGVSHSVVLIGGNGVDLISDWSMAREASPDTFDASMDTVCNRVEATYAS